MGTSAQTYSETQLVYMHMVCYCYTVFLFTHSAYFLPSFTVALQWPLGIKGPETRTKVFVCAVCVHVHVCSASAHMCMFALKSGWQAAH